MHAEQPSCHGRREHVVGGRSVPLRLDQRLQRVSGVQPLEGEFPIEGTERDVARVKRPLLLDCLLIDNGDHWARDPRVVVCDGPQQRRQPIVVDLRTQQHENHIASHRMATRARAVKKQAN